MYFFWGKNRLVSKNMSNNSSFDLLEKVIWPQRMKLETITLVGLASDETKTSGGLNHFYFRR